jgi:pimeloyl-ACP methyl ester carboxylesterase
MTGDAGELAALRDELSRDFSTITLDRRGYSRSPRGWTKSSVDEQAADLARLMDALGLESAFVFAVSIGAAAALKLLMRHPRRVSGALLHEPWVPALLADRDALTDTLARGEAAVVESRARRNTGPLEARLRFLMGAGFEALPTDVRGRVVKNGEMHAVECVYAFDWLPPVPGLLPADRSRWAVSAGQGSHPLLGAFARTCRCR